MKAERIYLGLCILGILIPYTQFVPFVRENGLDLPLLVDQLFSTQIGSFFGLDVIVSTIVLWCFVYFEGHRAKMKQLWLPVLASLTVGVSLGLPLFLYLREKQLHVST